jgi:NAD-dependent deacetylase
VITQNVDSQPRCRASSLLARSSSCIGNVTYAKCLDCEVRYELAQLEQQFTDTGRAAPCAECGGIVKTATISSGQSMPEREMRRAAA